MRVQKVYTYHWDNDFPLVVYYAKRDIQPGEELTYRRDSSDRKSVIGCSCGREGCAGRL